MNRLLPGRRLVALWLVALSLLAAGTAQAQLNVDLQIKRRLFILNEPILATVAITNQSGREITLEDTPSTPWFTFQITAADGRLVPTRLEKVSLQPLTIANNQTLKRTVNLNELFQLGDYGQFRVKSSIFFVPAGKFFGSRTATIELSEGQSIWKQTVGVPGGEANDFRTYTLLTQEHANGKYLYVRLTGDTSGMVYGCYNLGRMLGGWKPDAQFDANNNLAVLMLVNPRTYTLSQIGLDGTFQGQSTYVTKKSQPFLRRSPTGGLQLVGASRQEAPTPADTESVPKLSDRPAGF